MRRKGLKVLGLAMGMSLSMSLLSYAGEWKEDNIGKWYQNDNGTYPVNKWEWIDGNKDGIAECYYFNESGYCLIATTTPDNYTVNESGAWIVNGVVQTKSVNVSEDTESGNSNVNIPANNANQNEYQNESDINKRIMKKTMEDAITNAKEGLKYDVKQYAPTHPELQGITDEMIDNYSMEELAELKGKIDKIIRGY